MKALLSLVFGGLLWPAGLGAVGTEASSPGPGLPLLTNFSSVRQLGPVQAKLGYPVCVEGVVTYFDPVWGSLFLQDPTAGIWIDYGPEPPALRQGQRVQVEGRSSAGSFAPVVQASRLLVLGPGVEPVEHWVELKDLLSGRYDSQWIGFKGTVCSLAKDGQNLALWIDCNQGSSLKAYILDCPTKAMAWPWINAEVSVRGVCGTGFNQKGQLVSVHLLIPDLAHVEVLTPGPADVFAAPAQPIGTLLRFNPARTGPHLVHLCGSLTWQLPGEALVIQQQGDALYVETKQTEPLTLGDQVEVAGFVAVGGYVPRLVNGLYRKTGPGQPPRPLPARVNQIIQNQILDDTLDSQLLRVQALLTSRTEGSSKEVLLLRAEGQDFTAVLHRDEQNRRGSDGFGLRHLRPGSLLELTGVCFQRLDANHYIRSFELQLRTPADVRVLKAASWWTAPRLAVAFTVSFLASLGGLLLVMVLRAQVRAKTRQICQQLQREKVFTMLGAHLGGASNELDAARVLVNAARELIGYQSAFLWLAKAEQPSHLQLLLAQSAKDGIMADLARPAEIALSEPEAETLLQPRLIAGPPAQALEARLIKDDAGSRESGSTLIAPLRQSDDLLGVFIVQSGALRAYSPQDLQTLEALVTYSKASLARIRMEAQLVLKQKELVESSRAAGMAEVASSVLHNVGNVLSAVNVTSSLLTERIRHSKVGGLQTVATLLTEHRASLGAFMTEDLRGREVPGYLATLAERLTRERDENVAELASLRRDVTHIKEIIARQQSYARIGEVVETVVLSEVVEDALHINAASIERHQIQVVRDYGALLEIQTEKHKVLQILVNLLSNAKQALQASTSPQKRLVTRIEALGKDRARVSVIDNGMGIADENRERIFELGFTTRAEGHGFGLHNCALLARELGGALTFQSDGPGQGACFILELPVRRPEKKSCPQQPKHQPVC